MRGGGRRTMGAVATAAPSAMAAPWASGSTARQEAFARARRAMARYRDITKAVGFTELRDAAGIACIDDPAGGMGVHYVNTSRLDGVLDPALPEVLVYQPQADGSMRLGALEYVILAKDWTNAFPPELFGRDFEYMPGQDEADPNRYGLDAFWELHAWLWTTNPSGAFEDWNPRVTCP
jgi:PAS domain-containing protein